MRRPPVLLAGVLLLFVPLTLDALPLPDGIGACIDTLTAVADVEQPPTAGGYCPQLVEELGGHPLAQSIDGSIAEMRASQLAELMHFADRYDSASPSAALDLGSLDEVLRALPQLQEERESLSLWQYFARWLEWLFAEGDDEGSWSWLTSWLQGFELPESLASVLWILSIVLIVGLAVVILVNELRHSGFFGNALAADDTRPFGAASEYPIGASPRLSDLDSLPLEQRPSLVLRILVDRLRARGVAVRASFTHRELQRAMPSLGETQRQVFAAVCAAAERVAFSASQPGAEEIREVVARGVSLAESIAEGDPA